jgi:RNA polymerase-binding transcription factor DksA
VTRDAKVKKTAGTKAEPMESQDTKSYSPEELKRFRELILARRKETLEELDTLKESMMDVTTGEYISESSNYSLHMEQGTDAMEREKTFLFASRGSKFVNQLDDALARIEAKTYGVCKVCGLLVPKERLEAVPTAQTCAEYKNTGVPCERGRLALAKKKKGK